jgi:hypothetical protein
MELKFSVNTEGVMVAELQINTKILALMIIKPPSFFNFDGPLPRVMYPSSVEDAAIMVYQLEKNKSYPEPEKYSYRLFEIDLENLLVSQVCIPAIKFTY